MPARPLLVPLLGPVLVGLTVGFLLASAPSCGTVKSCGPSNCKGCCNDDGSCVTSPANARVASCGTAGVACGHCGAGRECLNFICTGGAGGGAASTCGDCTGCCNGTSCVPVESTTASSCGANAQACGACSGTVACTQGVCGGAGGAGGAGGGGSQGLLGDTCSFDSDCASVPVSATDSAAGFKAFCKKTMNPTGVGYAGGMCTRRCTSQAQCGPGNTCDYFDGPYGEIDNICLKGCVLGAPGACRPGYQCYNYGANGACYPVYADGGDVGPFDAGNGNRGNPAGQPCSSDLMCPPPDLGFCFSATFPDGGLSGFTGGECTAQCNQSLSDAWCGTNGACNGFIGPVTATGPAVIFLCQQQCTFPDAGTASACRAEYVCNAKADGVCTPRCNNPGGGCSGTTPTCNPVTGACGP